MDKFQLKAEAFKQRIIELVTDYEERYAELRVQFTLLQVEKNDLKQEIETLRSRIIEIEEKEVGPPKDDLFN